MSFHIHPKHTKNFIGHVKEKAIFENAFFNNFLHHSWLLEGPAGIGKATFAYCAARSILSLNKAQDNEISLFSDIESQPNNVLNFNFEEKNLIHNRVSENTHVDLKIIERVNIDKSLYSQEIIPVSNVREIENFFSKTSGENGWRIAIIDSLDNLNKHGSNSLLKILEEPPIKCLIFLISSNKSNVLDTIRSRCRILRFSALNDDDTKLIIKNNSINENEENLYKLNIISNGSPGKALMLLNNNGLEIYDYLTDMKMSSQTKEKVDLSINEKSSQKYFINNFNISDIPSLWANIFTQINKTYELNLDKRQAIINMVENIKKFKININVLD